MSLLARNLPRVWLIVPVCALVVLVLGDEARMRRADVVSGLQGRARTVDVPDAASPTGYADGQRELIVAEANRSSFHWIEQTQQMFARGEARVRHVDYENAPYGHDVSAASPYRWWLGLVAWFNRLATGAPIGLCVERAALYADPLLHLVLVAGSAIFVAWRFGAFASAVLSVGLVALFPFASSFLPSTPDPRGLSCICAFGSLLLLLAGLQDRGGGDPSRRRSPAWFALSGVLGGIGMWIGVQVQVPMTVGAGVGALLCAWAGRRAPSGAAPGAQAARLWRIWAYGGGLTVLAACLAEYFPGHVDAMTMGTVHPAYGLAWMGAGELLAVAVGCIGGERQPWGAGRRAGAFLAAAAVLAVPALMWRAGSWGFLEEAPGWVRLTALPNGATAADSWAWLARDGVTSSVWATFLPLLALIPAIRSVLRRATDPGVRSRLAFAVGPVLIAGGFAWAELSWWCFLDAAVLAMLVAATSGIGGPGSARSQGIWSSLALAFAIPGAIQLAPPGSSGPNTVLTPVESEELVERHLGHWLAKRAGVSEAVVYAPPGETTGLCFYGGLRGIGSFAPDNREGFAAALTIAAAPTMEEAQNDVLARGIRYIVVPSWDPFFDEFARRYLDKRFASRANFFIGELRRWNLPRWLRAVPYQIPVGGGFEGQSVLVFEVVSEQAPSAAASRLVEYMVETGDLGKAAEVAEGLRKYPGDVGALAARLLEEGARSDTEGAATTLEVLQARLAAGGDRYLPWDRRVCLAIALAQAGRADLSRDQASQCLSALNEARLRSLSTGSLFNLLVLGRAFRMEIVDPRLRFLAEDLLPEGLRGRL